MPSKKIDCGLTINFCCAMGEYRGPAAKRKFPGSKYVDFGYTGLHDWLTALPCDQRIAEIQLSYLGDFFILIVDQADENLPLFTSALKVVLSLFDQANIPYLILNSREIENSEWLKNS